MLDRTKLMLALTALAVAGVAGSAAAAPGGSERPFKATLSGAAVPTAAERCGGDLALAVAMSGTATHLGRLTAAGTHCTEWTLTTEAVPFWSGVATFTAPDGSTLDIRYEGSQEAAVGTVAALTVDVEVVGGTGRFAGAEGRWAGTGAIDFGTFTLDARLNGWISY